MIQVKRVYDRPSPADGYRVLVDRLWPRGLRKQAAGIDLWLKDVGPSAELRRWFAHSPERWDEFRWRYAAELAGKSRAVDVLREKSGSGKLTLVFAAKNPEQNNAVALMEYLAAKH
jgi:uncharacterized protein YeaO (DUF488 family)